MLPALVTIGERLVPELVCRQCAGIGADPGKLCAGRGAGPGGIATGHRFWHEHGDRAVQCPGSGVITGTGASDDE